MIQLFISLVLFMSSLGAHQTGLSYVDIKEDAQNKIVIEYKKPLGDSKADDIFIRYPLKCAQTTESRQRIVDGFIINEYELWCSEDGLADSRIWVEGLVSSDRGVLIRYEKDSVVETSLLRATTPFMYINHKSGAFELFREYLELGIVHIWMGFDHLLFVLGILLLAKNRKILLYSVTGFTIAHSITLAFGILGVMSVSILYVEAMIALSILFLARELLKEDSDSFTRKYLGVVAFIFGLLHGFGFSSVLQSIGLPQDEIALSLLAFNLGIEVGQILFILALSLLFFGLKKNIEKSKIEYKILVAYLIGSLSSFWFIERVLLF